MAENSFFYTSVSGDRVTTAENLRTMFNTLYTSGVIINPSTSLQVDSGDGDMEVTVNAGTGWILGGFYQNTADAVFTVQTADGSMDRIDSIVLRYDASARAINLAYVKGTASASPSMKAPTQTDSLYELVLAKIYVGKGTTAISAANVYDMRYTDSCGIVTGAVEQIDASTLFGQIYAQFNEWFNGVKGTLGEDSAGNLLQLTETNATNIATNTTTIENLPCNADVIRVKLATDYVPSGEIYTLPFTTAFKNGVTSTSWGELQSDGSIKILKAGEYKVGLNFFVSDANGIDFFHVRTKNRATDITIGENYVARDGKFCSGNAFNQTYLAKGEIVSVHIFPAILTRSYRISQKQTHLMVAPVRFDS